MNKKTYLFKLLLMFLVFFYFSFLCSLFSFAKSDYPCLSTQWAHEKSDLKPDPAVIFGRLPNGFRYVLMNNHEPRDRVSIQLNIQAGSLHETDEQQGLGHYLEHMLFNGSEHFPPGELVKYFQSIGMSFGADTNGYTSFAETVYNILLPAQDKESLEKGLLIMKDYARGALLLKSEVERERGIILAEKRLRDSVDYRTYIASMKFLFEGSKIPDRLPIGTEEDIKNATREILKDYYDTWYRPENMVLVMVGDFDTNMAESLMKSEFSNAEYNWNNAPRRLCPDAGTVKHEGIKTFYHFEKEAGNTETSVQAVWNTEPKQDSFAYQKERLTQYLANTILNNRLNAMMEKPDNPFTSASVYSGIFISRFGYAEISAESAPENWEKVLGVLEQSLRQAIEFGFTQPELDRVKKEFLAELADAVLKKDTRDSTELTRAIIRNINSDSVFQSPEQEKALYAPFIESLTTEQVHKAFADIWNRNHRLVLVTGNADISNSQQPTANSQQPQNVIRKIFEASAKIEVKPPEQKKAIQFPYLPEPEKTGTMRQQTKISDLGIEQIDFENNVRLNLKKTDFKKNEIMTAISFGWGKKTEPVSGLALLAESLLNKSGLGRLTQTELERALAGKKTSVKFEVEENRFLLSGKTVPEETELLFQLLYAYLKDPGYRNEAYTLVMRQFGQMYKELVHSIEGQMEMTGERFLAGGDSRFGMPKYEDFQKLTMTQVKDWIDPARHSKLEISVVGDFDPETVKLLASKYFGSLPAAEPAEDENASLKFPAGKDIVIDVETEINKGVAVVAWHTTDFSSIYRVRRLSVLGYVFSDRLREEIREKLGATYSQYAYNQSSRTYEGYGIFRSVLFIDPDMSEKMIAEVKRIAADIAKNSITEDELRRAVDPVLTSLKDMVRTNAYWLNTVLTGSVRYPQQLEWSRTLQKDYAAITVQDISDLAKTYLNNEKAATIIIRPAEK